MHVIDLVVNNSWMRFLFFFWPRNVKSKCHKWAFQWCTQDFSNHFVCLKFALASSHPSACALEWNAHIQNTVNKKCMELSHNHKFHRDYVDTAQTWQFYNVLLKGINIFLNFGSNYKINTTDNKISGIESKAGGASIQLLFILNVNKILFVCS